MKVRLVGLDDEALREIVELPLGLAPNPCIETSKALAIISYYLWIKDSGFKTKRRDRLPVLEASNG